ncbi:hypothetical protein BGZ76_004131, partial [Entomortierella beljakovae]
MAINQYVNWALGKHTKDVSYPNFVKQFDFTNKGSADEEYMSVITSSHFNQRRQRKLRDSYEAFQKRSDESFWANRNLEIANRMLALNSATVAKKAGVEVQDAGLREATLGLRKNSSKSVPVVTFISQTNNPNG